jgi:hypothetical protein
MPSYQELSLAHRFAHLTDPRVERTLDLTPFFRRIEGGMNRKQMKM